MNLSNILLSNTDRTLFAVIPHKQLLDQSVHVLLDKHFTSWSPLSKTGLDAGQTAKHWHLHVIFSTNATQDIWGKITIIKNILFGSSPMKKDDLAKKVADLRDELKMYTESQ